ncbi:putative E3 ubiquitin-protein ligase MGRN1 [Trichinella pseudospiralis]|uniref:Putative E3 ubiquitin-protein ligase MGRN1 n=1 Tax=Trichinella pseudospiralis TaxID=6337 RepID=A0A0V0YP75_TRIPS|nr:putative E3 ubiquitin-protein ligase MGRN1 [Trichinella pseudospiralis]
MFRVQSGESGCKGDISGSMGISTSRSSHSLGDGSQSPTFMYKFPPKASSFFGTHFMLGEERFETPQPESFLFGENLDLNFLGNPVNYPYLHQSASEPYNVLNCFLYTFTVFFFNLIFPASLGCLFVRRAAFDEQF